MPVIHVLPNHWPALGLLARGRFRTNPLGIGAYTGSIKLNVANTFPNGEDGNCAPLTGRTELRTGLARFTVSGGTGQHAGANGHGLASFTEDAANHHRMTLVGRIAR